MVDTKSTVRVDGNGVVTKLCSGCGERKQLDEFAVQKAAYDSRAQKCRVCFRAYHREWYLNNKEHQKENARRYRKENPDARYKYDLKKYGITLEDYNELFATQQGCCVICGKHQSETSKRLHVDHCHSTGAVRGLLCCKCNTALGMVDDDIQIMANMIDYINNHLETEK